MKKHTIVALVALAVVLAFVAGWVAGRRMLEREWGNPVATITAEDAKRASVDGADPTPAAGTRVLRALPLRRMREAVKVFVEKDPVVMKVGSFARDDDDKELHLVVENRGDCRATRLAGVAYGYHATGAVAAVNKGGEPYLAFDVKEAKIDPKASGQVSMPVKYPGVASLAVAHVDLVECEGGKTWKR